MNIFNPIIKEIHGYKQDKHQRGLSRKFRTEEASPWPKAGNRDIILMPDLAVEFGSPETASVSFILWTGDASLVEDGKITLVGPDVTQTTVRHNPLGKVVIAEVTGFDETNAFYRNREIYLKKFDLSLKGVMLRSASHYMAEWNRISTAAVRKGLSFHHLGSALIDEYKRLDYVNSAEVVYITSSDGDVNALYEPGNRAARTIQAMSKMVNEMSYDCSGCDYQDLCGEAAELRSLKARLKKKQGRS